jgi:transcription elongation factor Elf1
MMFKTYPPFDREGLTPDEIKRGFTWLYTDYECVHCGKLQSVAQAGGVGAPCIACGKRLTDPKEK